MSGRAKLLDHLTPQPCLLHVSETRQELRHLRVRHLASHVPRELLLRGQLARLRAVQRICDVPLPAQLLLHRRQIEKLARETDQSGRTIVPLAIYFSDGYAKVEIAIATGKRDWDKRQSIAEREANREAHRAMSDHLKRRRR